MLFRETRKCEAILFSFQSLKPEIREVDEEKIP